MTFPPAEIELMSWQSLSVGFIASCEYSHFHICIFDSALQWMNQLDIFIYSDGLADNL